MIDRGIIKWRPFDSCYSSQSIIKDIRNEKNKLTRPFLSDDQLETIEEEIINIFNLQITARIEYFYDGFIKTEVGKIEKINKEQKKICLNHKFIYFKQILKINY